MNEALKEMAGKLRNDPVYRLFRFAIELLIFLALVALSTLLLRPLQQGMQLRMTEVRNSLLSRVELLLDRRIEYSSMGPSIFGSLDIRNIRVYGAGPTGSADSEAVITIDRFRLSYSFWELLQGIFNKASRGKLPESIRSVRIDRPVITLDLNRDADLGTLFFPSPGKDPGVGDSRKSWDPRNDTMRGISAMIPEKLRIQVRGGEFRILPASSGGTVFQVEGLNFDARAETGRFLFDGHWTARAELAAFFGQSLGASMSGQLNGELSRDLNNGSLTIGLPALSGDYFNMRALTVNLTLTEKDIEIRKINDRLPVDFWLSYDFDTHRVNASFQAENFSARDLLSFTGPWRKYNNYLGIRSTGSASISHSPGGEISYELDLSGSMPAVLAGRPVSYALAGRGDERYFGFDRCEFRLPMGELSFTGGLGIRPFARGTALQVARETSLQIVPDGTVHVSDFSLTGDGVINGDFTVSSSGRTINLFGEGVSLGPVVFAVLDGDLVREEQGFTFALSALRFRNIESYEDVQLSSISLEGSFDQDPSHLQGSLALESFSLSDILNLIRPLTAFAPMKEPVQGITEDLSITAEVFVTTDFKHILYNAPRMVAAYSGRRPVYALLSLSGTDRRFELNQGQLVWANGSAEASGFTDFSNPNDITFSFQTAYEDMFYYLDGELLDRHSLSMRGSYGLQVFIGSTGLGGYSGYVETASMPIPIGKQFSRLSTLISFRYDNADFWALDVEHLDVQGLATPGSDQSSLSISGGMDQDGLRFRRILFDDGRGLLSGNATAGWGVKFTNPVGSLIIGEQGGTELARIDGNYIEGELSLSFSGTGLQLGRLLGSPHNMVFTGNGNFNWRSLDSYSLNITLEELSARAGDNDIILSGGVDLNQDEITLNEFTVNYGGLRGEWSLFHVDRREALISAAARVRGNLMGRILETSFNTDMVFAPINSWLSIGRAIDSFEGILNVENFRIDNTLSRQPFIFVFSRDLSRISLSGGPGDMLRLQVSDKGEFYAALSNPAPIRGSITGVIGNNTIDARTTDLYVDLGSLWRFIPGKDMVNVPGGFAEVSVQIRGSLGDPEFFGTVRGQSVRLQVPNYLGADIEPVPMLVILEGNEMNFGPIPARVGGGAGMITGWFRFDRWIPNIFTLDIKVPEETGIPFKVDIGGIKGEGDASGHLLLSMADLVFSVTGDLFGNNAEVSPDTQTAVIPGQPFSVRSSGKISTMTNLRISTGPKVEFVYPSRDLPWIRANAAAGSVIRITSDSLSGRFTVDGDVNIRNGELYYFQRNFYIREGVLNFKESELLIEPRITARAETRDRNEEGPVTISMIVENSPLQSFSPRLESNPALSQTEILSMLGQNLTGAPSEDPNDIYRSIGSATSDFLTQFFLVRLFERRVRDFLHLDMFSIRTQILQNAVFQATGLQEPVDRISGVGNYFDNTTVYLGKYFGPNIFGQTMLSLRYDENRTTFGELSQGGLTLGAGVSLEAELGIEMRNPLFSIQFNFAPRHLENMFVDDVSFTILWKRSYKNLRDLWKKEP